MEEFIKEKTKMLDDKYCNLFTTYKGLRQDIMQLIKDSNQAGIKKALEIISDVYKEIPLEYSYEEDARYNYPERDNEIDKRLNSLLPNAISL